MDLDGDGRRDVITGCWPGELYLFRGTEKGLAAATRLTYADGKEISLGSASTVFATDWEGDGDLDLLVGDIEGNVWRVPNGSGGKVLAFEAAVSVRVGGKDVTVDGDSHPVMADWDGDGRLDLLVGAGDGAVTCFRDLARAGEPLLAPARVLLAPARRMSAPATKGAPAPGGRTKVAVADWDEDGRLDLLVGDFNSSSGEAPDLTDEQVKRRDELLAEQERSGTAWVKRYEAAMAEAAKAAGVEGDWRKLGRTPEGKRQLETLQRGVIEAIQADPELGEAYQKRQQVLWEELAKLMPAHEAHGYVWLFAGSGGRVASSKSAVAPAPPAPAAPEVPGAPGAGTPGSAAPRPPCR